MPAAEWSVSRAPAGASRRLESALGISRLLARVLAARGWADPADASSYLHPTWNPGSGASFPGVGEAVRLLRAAQRAGRRIAVYGDYDADGVLGTVILRDALARAARRARRRGAGQPVDYYIPHRSEEGYGLNEAAVYHLAKDRGVQVLVTVDCGIQGHQEVELARRLGMEVVITDHHLPGEELPPASAIVHPALAGQHGAQDAASEPCGALVALKLAQGLLDEIDPGWLDLAAVATLADVVSLLGENRALVSARLPWLAASPNLGLRTLMEHSGLAGRPPSARDVAFGVVPRINAMGRVGDAKGAVEAFSTGLPLEALHLVQQMERDNGLRRAQEDEVLAQARLQLPAWSARAALVAAGDGWPVGVLGIVASRLARLAHRPAAVVALDEGIGYGSARSVPGCDLYRAMSECAPLLDRYGGHRQAVGFRLAAGRVEDFARRLAEAVSAQGPAPRRVEVDALADLSEIDEPALADLARLEPTGQANPPAALGLGGCEVLESRRVGQDGSHLKLTVRQGRAVVGAIAFSAADELAPICGRGRLVDLAFSPQVNEYQGKRSIQLRVSAARLADPAWAGAAGDQDLGAGG